MMDQSKLVSIVIPCYNYGAYLNECLKSCLLQTYNNIEIIVVDDGSTDKATIKFLNEYKNDKVKIVKKPNEGVTKTRNKAIGLSNGDFFIPLDADDMIAPTFVEKTMEIMLKDEKIGVVYTNQKLTGLENKMIEMMEFDPIKILTINHVSVTSLVRKEAFEQVKNVNGHGFNPNMEDGNEDWDLWISISELGWKFSLIKEQLFIYRKHGISRDDRAIQNHERLVNQMIDNHTESYKTHFKEAIVDLQVLFKDRDLKAKHLEENVNDLSWLLKRLGKKILGIK